MARRSDPSASPRRTASTRRKTSAPLATAGLQAHLKARGVDTLIHYPVPIPRQPAVASERPSDCPVADRVCDEVLSLPLHPGLTRQAVEEVAAALQAFHVVA